MTVAILLSLINISSDTTIEDIVSIVVSGIYPSYLIVSIFLFYRRVRGDISRYNDNEDDIINVPGITKAYLGILPLPRYH